MRGSVGFLAMDGCLSLRVSGHSTEGAGRLKIASARNGPRPGWTPPCGSGASSPLSVPAGPPGPGPDLTRA
ncbi:hypothetical protein GCM10009760_30020 [Kitasatospora kazusensis]|uniref:Uncharacterized protein n=1 Tax=Kitasatospora kazusensis TaxID=407974 RepID=A0ABN2ZKA1_9ACTN